MKVLLTGAGGQLGRHLIARAPEGIELVTTTRTGGDHPCDLTDHASLARILKHVRPEVVINSAAWTAVDDAEDHTEQALKLNRDLPAALAGWCKVNDAGLITYSTDYVFSGQPGRPWQEDDPVAPESVYGLSKMAGEREVLLAGCRGLVVRTAWVYSALPGNFLSAILGRAARGQDLRVVNDQVGSPTWAGSLAQASWTLMARALDELESPALVHVAGRGEMSWYDFASLAVTRAAECGLIEKPVQVEPIGSDQWPQKARRPAWSVLDSRRYSEMTGESLDSVETALEHCLEQWNLETC
jgi:dTDP-4-dehydrorhamnose reductase